MTESKFSQSLDFSKNKDAYVYFLGNEGHSLYKARLDGSKPECVSQEVPAGMNSICTYHTKKGWLICAFGDPYHANSVEPLLKILNPSATRLDGYCRSDNHGGLPAAYLDLTSPPPANKYENYESQKLPTWEIYWANAGFESGIIIRPYKSKNNERDESYLALDTPVLQLWCQHVVFFLPIVMM
jgi:hypothetical protein